MSWYKITTPHDGMHRGLVVELKDTADVKKRVARGYLKKLPRTEAPDWQTKQKGSISTSTEPST
jgi:hypothetical protein